MNRKQFLNLGKNLDFLISDLEFYKKKVIDKKLVSCFKVLVLNSNSNLREVKSKYKILAKKWHPDVQNQINSKNKDTFINITNAYKTILKSFTKPVKN